MSQGGPSLWTVLPQSGPAPCDRYKHSCCSYDGHVYLLGGRENRTLRDFWKYSVVYNEWTELSCIGEAAPEELEEHSMVAHQGFLYVFGGMLDSAYNNCCCALWVYDLEKKKWVHCQGKMNSSQRLMPTNRKGHSAVVLNSTMVVYGGFVDIKGSSKELWRLDLDTMVWSMLSNHLNDTLSPGPRHGHSAVAHQGCMYLFGGLKGLQEQNDLWRWTSSSNMWTPLKNKSGPPRLMGHSAATYQGSMLLFGGGLSHNTPKNGLWRYRFTTQTWIQMATLEGSTPPPAKIHHCCVELGPGCIPGPPEVPQHSKIRPFKNKCFPAPLTFLGCEGAIELKTFRKESQRPLQPEFLSTREGPWTYSSLTVENKGFKKTWSYSEDQDQDEDVAQHLPDLLLVLGGRPCSTPAPISVWQLTLCDSKQQPTD